MEALPGDYDYQSGPVDDNDRGPVTWADRENDMHDQPDEPMRDHVGEPDAPMARDLEFEREVQQQKELNNELEGDMIVLCHGLGKLKEQGPDAEPVFVRTRETLAYIKDIRRLLNFDFKTNVQTREIFAKLGTWNLMQKKIIPLLKSYWDDRLLTFELLKVMVLLTDAPSDLALPQQREKHLTILHKYKDAFLQDDVLAMLMQLVADPLSREGRERTDDDIKFIELVLHLFKNLLVVPDADLKEASRGDNLSHMHDDLIVAFHQENVLEMLLIMTQDIREQRYQHWGVLVMEMLACIFRNKTADSLLAAATAGPTAPAPINSESQPIEPTNSAKKTVPPPKFDPADPLYSLLCQDKQKQLNSRRNASSRHNRFYGSFRIQVSKSKPFRGFRRGYKDLLPVAPPPMKGRKKRLVTWYDPKVSGEVGRILVKFVDDFLEYSYSQMLQVVVRKIVHMSPEIRLEDIINFCTVNSLILSVHCANPNLNEQKIGLVAHAIEQHNFRFLMRQFDENADPKIKQWHLLPPILSCLRAMLATVRLVGKDAGASAKAAARRLELNLLYDQQMCTMVTQQLRVYEPHKHDRHFVGDLIEVANCLVKMTEEFTKSQQTVLIRNQRTKKKKKTAKKNAEAEGEEKEGEEEEEEEEEMAEMDDHDSEKELTVAAIVQNFCHPKIVQQYVLVLEHCLTNPARLNKCVVRMLTMICKHEEGHMLPMLYHVPTLRVMQNIMNDVPVQLLKTRNDLRETLDFSKAIVRNFLRTLKTHAVLGCDALFFKNRHTANLISYNYDVPVIEKKGNKSQAHQDVEVAVAHETDWQEHEDQLLRDQYPGLAEKQGVCNILAHQLGGDRNAQMVSRRLATLGLRKQGAALRASSLRGPDFLRKTVGILRQQAHEALSNTIRRATHPGLRAQMLVAAMEWVRGAITQAFQLREELHMDAVKYARRVELPEDYCLVPVTADHWKWMGCHWLPAVLNCLCIRPPVAGETWWRIPKEVDNAKVEMCMDVLQAFLDEPPEQQPESDLQEDSAPFEDADKPEEEQSGAEDDERGAESSEESDEEWTDVRAKKRSSRRHSDVATLMQQLPDNFEEPVAAADEEAAEATDEQPTKKKEKKKRKKASASSDEKKQAEQKKSKKLKMKKKLAKLTQGVTEEQEEGPQTQEEEQAVPQVSKRRKLQRNSQIDSDAEGADAPEPEGNTSDVDVVPDSYAPAKHRQKRRKAMISDSDDE